MELSCPLGIRARSSNSTFHLKNFFEKIFVVLKTSGNFSSELSPFSQKCRKGTLPLVVTTLMIPQTILVFIELMADKTEETKPVGKVRPGKKKKLGAGKNLLAVFNAFHR